MPNKNNTTSDDLRGAGRLAINDNGRTLADLLAKNGLYARLWAHQSGGFLVEQ